MINNFKKFLESRGFKKIERREFLRPSSPISALIYDTPLRVGQNDVRVNVAIEVADPWVVDRTYHVLDLRGDITAEGIFVHYDETPCWIRPDEEDLIYKVIESCLLHWIDHWSDVHRLIQYFEYPVDVIMTRPSNDIQSCETIVGVPVKRRDSPSENHLLSLLYYHAGNFGKALAAAERYCQFVERMASFEGEPERTNRQIEELLSKTK